MKMAWYNLWDSSQCKRVYGYKYYVKNKKKTSNQQPSTHRNQRKTNTRLKPQAKKVIKIQSRIKIETAKKLEKMHKTKGFDIQRISKK